MARTEAKRSESLGKVLFDAALRDELAKLESGVAAPVPAKPASPGGGTQLDETVKGLEEQISRWRVELQELTAVLQRLAAQQDVALSEIAPLGSSSGSVDIERLRVDVARLRQQIEGLERSLAASR